MRFREILIGAKWICDYLEIPNYLMVRYTGAIEGEKKYTKEETFWRDLLGSVFYDNALQKPRLFEGDVVTLNRFQLSQWVSRMPGLYWTDEGYFLRRRAYRYMKNHPVLNMHYEPYGKGLMINGGLGVIRLDSHDDCQIFGVTSSGKIDASIPVICNKKVARALNTSLKKYPLLEVDLRGIIKRVPLTYTFFARNVPRYCIYIDTSLNVKKYISDFELEANAWTIYCDPKVIENQRCGFTFAKFNPIDEMSIINATNWIQDFIDHYTKSNGYPITDFDGIIPRFKSAKVPMASLMINDIDFKTLNRIHKKIDFRNQMQQLSFRR